MNYERSRSHRKAFTIVELLIVIVVIGIIVGIVVVSYGAVTRNARQQATKTDAQTIASQLNKYKADKGSYPDTLGEITTPAGVNSTFQYSYDATAGSYCITASTQGASAYVKSGSIEAKEGGCPGHGVNGEAAITNLASNPSAEASTAGVSGYNGSPITRVSGGAVSGGYIFSTTTNSASSAQGIIHTITTSAKPNQEYTCSISIKGSGGAVIFSGRPATASSAYISENLGTKVLTVTSSWQRVSSTFTTPATTGILRIQVRYQTAGSGMTIQTDAILCVEGGRDYTFADGSSAHWLWTGSEHLSSSYGPAL